MGIQPKLSRRKQRLGLIFILAMSLYFLNESQPLHQSSLFGEMDILEKCIDTIVHHISDINRTTHQ